MDLFYNRDRNNNFLCKGGVFCLLMSLSLVTNAQLTQNFGSTTWPPNGWSLYSTIPMTTRASLVNGFASPSGVGAVKVDFWNQFAGTIDSLKTPVLNPTIAGDTLVFDHA